jgi:hypothetical protein
MIRNIINTNIDLLYKQTENKYAHDDDVDKDDLEFMCYHLYQLELLHVFKLTHDDDISTISNHVYTLFNLLKLHPTITNLIQTHFLLDDFTTFFTFFSFDLLYIIYPILSNIALTDTDTLQDTPHDSTINSITSI